MKLELYDIDGNLFKYELDRPFVTKPQSRIYRLEDGKCLKYFLWRYSECNDMTLRTIANMNLDGFYKIHDILYNRDGEFVSYTMDYYSSLKNSNLLTMPIDYTIDSFRILNDSIIRLSEEGIRVTDLHSDNVILTDNGIIVIDVDLYVRTLYFTDDILFEKNIASLYSLFKKIYKDSLIIYHFNSGHEIDCRIVDELFCSKNSVDTVCKKLVKYKYPIDYIRSERRW